MDDTGGAEEARHPARLNGEEARRGSSYPTLPLPFFGASVQAGLPTNNVGYASFDDDEQARDPREIEKRARSATRIACRWRVILAVRRLQRRLIDVCRPESFCLKLDNEQASWGSVAFEAHGLKEAAKYIALSEDSNIERAVGLVRTTWGVKDAQVVISLTGGAQELKLKPHVLDVFNRGLVRAAQQTNAWIVTGGTDTGVMKLVGEAVRDYQADVPCIGIATWGVVHGREQLAANRGKEEFYYRTQANDAAGASLEPNHTHFLLVDTGKDGARAWGGEIDFRTRFEQAYCRRNKVPMVLVVVGGGGGTLTTIEKAAANRVPIVLISDSGGAPAVIAKYMKTGKIELDPRGERGFKPPSNPKELRKWEEQVARIRQLHHKHKVITTFSTRQGETRNLDLVLLKAMLFDTEGNLRQADLHESKKMLHLAIDWGRQEIVAQWMEKSAALYAVPLRDTSPASSPGVSPSGSSASLNLHQAAARTRMSTELQEALQEALQIALVKRKSGIVDLLLKANLQAESIDLCNLYYQTLDNLAIFDTDLADVRVGLRDHFAQVAAEQRRLRSPRRGRRLERGADGKAGGAAAERKSRWTAAVLKDQLISAVGGSRMGKLAASMRRVGGGSRSGLLKPHELFRDVLVPFIARTCHMDTLETLWRSGQVRAWSADDVFYWAVLMADEPLKMALVASQMTSQLAHIARFDSERFATLARTYESWAIGVLDQCEHELEARWLLQKPFSVTLPGFADGTLISLAIRTQRKGFIAHTHVQSLLDAWWRGDIVASYDPARRRGTHCLSSTEPHALLVIAHALTLCLLPLVRMEPTLAVKHELATEQHQRASALARRPAAQLQRGGAVEYAHNVFRTMQLEADVRPRHVHAAFDFYAAPKTKFWLRACSYLVFLSLYALVLVTDDGTPDASWPELCFMGWTFGLAVDELHQFVTNRRSHRAHFSDVWNFLDAIMFALLFPAIFVLRFVALFACCVQPATSIELGAGGEPLGGDGCRCLLLNYARIALAANAVLCFFRFLAFYRVHPRLGVLIHVITEIQNDVGMFVAILLFVVLGFMMAFSGLHPPRRLELRADETSPFLIPIWNFFDLSDISDVTEHSLAPALGMTLLALYLFMSQILLVNLLIAMMNTSYAVAHKNAEREWASSRASSIEELLALSSTPPPFSAPLLLYDIFAPMLLKRVAPAAPAAPAAAPPASPSSPSSARRGAVKEGKKRRHVKLLHEYLEVRWRTEAESVESRVIGLRDEVDRLTSMLESASSDRADSRAVLDALAKDRAETLRAIKELHGALERAGLVTPKPLAAERASASARADEDGDQGFSALSLAVPAGRSRLQPPTPQYSPKWTGADEDALALAPAAGAAAEPLEGNFALPPTVSPAQPRAASPPRPTIVLSAPPFVRRSSPPPLRTSAPPPPPPAAPDFSAPPLQRDGLDLPPAPAKLTPNPTAARDSPVATVSSAGSSAQPARRDLAVPDAPRAAERQAPSFASRAESASSRDGELGVEADDPGREAALAATLRERVIRLRESGSSSGVPPPAAAATSDAPAAQLDRRALTRQRIASAAATGNRIAMGRSEQNPLPGDRPNDMM